MTRFNVSFNENRSGGKYSVQKISTEREKTIKRRWGRLSRTKELQLFVLSSTTLSRKTSASRSLSFSLYLFALLRGVDPVFKASLNQVFSQELIVSGLSDCSFHFFTLFFSASFIYNVSDRNQSSLFFKSNTWMGT